MTFSDRFFRKKIHNKLTAINRFGIFCRRLRVVVFLHNVYWMGKAVDGNFVVTSELVVAFCEVTVGEENVSAVEDCLGKLEIEGFGGDCCCSKCIPDLFSAIESWRCLPEFITFAS
jgi:hypothetical protein